MCSLGNKLSLQEVFLKKRISVHSITSTVTSTVITPLVASVSWGIPYVNTMDDTIEQTIHSLVFEELILYNVKYEGIKTWLGLPLKRKFWLSQAGLVSWASLPTKTEL